MATLPLPDIRESVTVSVGSFNEYVATPFNFLTLTFNKKPAALKNFIKSTGFVRFKLDLTL